MNIITCIGIFLLFFIIPIHSLQASLHPKMGAPHVLDPEGEGFVTATSAAYGERPFSSSTSYRELLEVYKAAQKEGTETADPQQKVRLQKIIEATQKVLIHLSLEDRQKYVRDNKPQMKRYKEENRFFPLNSSVVSEKSGALLWAHRHNILGKGAHIIALEKVGYIR